MSDYNTLLNQIQDSINLSSQLTKDQADNFYLCLQSLIAARDALSGSQDRSAECKCQCHVDPKWHFLPCGCYSGNPVLE